MKHQQLIFQVSLALSASVPFVSGLAQDITPPEIAPLDEDFLLFLSGGIEVDGEWKDPMTLAQLSDLDEMSSEEIAWVAEQDKTELETITADIVEGRSNDGEENE